ncbi:hypothetical protein F4604DRAFT_1927769 [Suillus subluteus]|nr:hypothetical protein F4604DRAFT_1927769 [Suillus subluteus]
MASWTLVFRDTLNKHQDAFVAAKGNSSMRARILKKIKDTIVNSETAKDPCIMLPEKNIRKAVCTYYLDFLEDDEDRKVEEEIIEGGHKDRSAPDAVTVEMVRDWENDKPEDAGKYKTEFSGFDVVQKLFKDKFGEYDKQCRNTSDLKSMGQRTKLARTWHQAMSPEVKQELERVASKWNREGPPADTKDRYCSCNQKKVMEDFIDMVRRTMGLHVVMLAAYDRGEGRTPGTTIWETAPQKAKKSFSQSSKDNKKWAGQAQDRLANWLLEGEYVDEVDSDEADDDEDNLLDLTVDVDDEGYPCLPKGFGSLKLKHRQKVVHSIFQKAYTVITNNPQAPVPWGEVSEILDPSHMQKDTITAIYSHWKDRTSHDTPLVRFVGYRQADFYDSHTKKGDEEQRLKKVDDGKSSSDEDEVDVDTTPIPDSCPKYHLTRDMVGYLKSLSALPSFHHLLAAVEKLPHTAYSTARKQRLPVWASWTWSQTYLPQGIHGNMETAAAALEDLSNYQFNSCGMDRIVILGLGLLLSDEASADIPDYLGNSILGFEVGDQIEEKIAGIEADIEALLKDGNVGLSVVRQDIEKRRAEERKKLKQAQTKKAEEASIVDEKRRVEEENRRKEEKRVEEEKRVLEEKKREDEKRAIEEKRMEEERLAEEASKAGGSVRKSDAKGKGKWPAADLGEPLKKKVKASLPDPPRRSGRDKAAPKRYQG